MFKLAFILFPLLCLAEVKMLFIGDSLTEGYGIAKEKSYPSLLSARLLKEKIQVKVINGAISGSTSSSALSRYKWFRKAGPDIVVLALGANDGLRGIKPAELERNLERAILSILKDGKRVVLAGMRTPPNYGPKFAREFRQVFPRLAKKHKLVLIPFLLDKVAGEAALNQGDGIHPNEEGHQVMMETVYKYLRPLL